MIQKESQNKFEIKMGIDDLDPNDRQNVTNTDDKQTEKGLNYVTSRTTKNAPFYVLSQFLIVDGVLAIQFSPIFILYWVYCRDSVRNEAASSTMKSVGKVP